MGEKGLKGVCTPGVTKGESTTEGALAVCFRDGVCAGDIVTECPPPKTACGIPAGLRDDRVLVDGLDSLARDGEDKEECPVEVRYAGDFPGEGSLARY